MTGRKYEKPFSLDLPFDEALERLAQTDPEEINPVALNIKKLPAKMAAKEINPNQGSLDLHVDRQMEVQGIGMGVLSDGTAFLNQRGLAGLCGVQNAHIGTISSGWNEEPPTPRVSKIKELLAARGVTLDSPHIELLDSGKPMFAYPDMVCLAILEYYAFEAGTNNKDEARKNFRLLAGKALQDFIYAQTGYDPTNAVPDAWKQFHDRISLTYDAVPKGYFGIFKEIADMIITLGQNGLHIDASFVPDISVGKAWSAYWTDNNLGAKYGERIEYAHSYPDYFPQSKSNPQYPFCYPEAALGDFRRWMRERYIGDGKFTTYLEGKVKQRQLPASFAQLAIAAYRTE